MFVVAPLLFAVFAWNRSVVWNQQDREFHEGPLNGIIRSGVMGSTAGNHFQMVGSDKKYTIRPYQSIDPERFFLSDVASPGDSLAKEAYGDTLFVYTEERVYKFLVLTFD